PCRLLREDLHSERSGCGGGIVSVPPPHRRLAPGPGWGGGSWTCRLTRGATAARSERDAVLGQPRHRVDLLSAVLPDLEVQVRAGRLAAVAHRGDLLAGVDLLTLGDQGSVDVAVDRDRAVVVLDADPLTEPAGRAGVDHFTGCGRVDRRTEVVGNVDAEMTATTSTVRGRHCARSRPDHVARPGGLLCRCGAGRTRSGRHALLIR